MNIKDQKQLMESVNSIVTAYGNKNMDELINGCWAVIKADWEYKELRQQIRRTFAWGRTDQLMTIEDIFSSLQKHNPGFTYPELKKRIQIMIDQVLRDEDYKAKFVDGKRFYMAALSKNLEWNNNNDDGLSAEEFMNA